MPKLLYARLRKLLYVQIVVIVAFPLLLSAYDEKLVISNRNDVWDL